MYYYVLRKEEEKMRSIRLKECHEARVAKIIEIMNKKQEEHGIPENKRITFSDVIFLAIDELYRKTINESNKSDS